MERRFDVPNYAELSARKDAPQGSSWGVFGSQDELGSINFMTDESVQYAMSAVNRGKVFNLDYEINAFPGRQSRPSAEHTITSRHVDHRDDHLDGFYLQGSSQIDGLRHRRHHEFGFYNGVNDEAIVADSPTLGIGRWAETGIVGRGILLDLERAALAAGDPIDFCSNRGFDVDDLERIAQLQGVEFASGDVLLVRTGWAKYLLEDAAADYVESMAWTKTFPGLAQSREMLGWLWDNQFALVASDNVALEVSPPLDSSPFWSDTDGKYMHQDMIGLLGLAIGELWNLDALAADCAATGTYECAVISKPLFVAGGVGSPANVMALR